MAFTYLPLSVNFFAMRKAWHLLSRPYIICYAESMAFRPRFHPIHCVQHCSCYWNRHCYSTLRQPINHFPSLAIIYFPLRNSFTKIVTVIINPVFIALSSTPTYRHSLPTINNYDTKTAYCVRSGILACKRIWITRDSRNASHDSLYSLPAQSIDLPGYRKTMSNGGPKPDHGKNNKEETLESSSGKIQRWISNCAVNRHEWSKWRNEWSVDGFTHDCHHGNAHWWSQTPFLLSSVSPHRDFVLSRSMRCSPALSAKLEF